MLPKIASGKQWGVQWGVASCNSRAKEEGNTELGMHSRMGPYFRWMVTPTSADANLFCSSLSGIIQFISRRMGVGGG